MNKEFIPYEQALALKELGFDEPCIAFYNGKFLDFKVQGGDNCSPYLSTESRGECPNAPTFSQAFRFFREKYGYLPNIHNFNGNFKATLSGNCNWLGSWTKTYEEAELACLIKLIEIVKNK
jgi:hypothetical protein